MTDLLERAFEAVRKLSPRSQNKIARVIIDLAKDEIGEPIDPEHLEAVLEGLAQADRREFASEAEVEAILHRFRR